MVQRLLLGLVIGLVLGALVAAVLVKGMGLTLVGAFLAYTFAAVTGVLTGLVAGKPIWAKGGQIEAGLKAVFGALLAAGAMFAIRTWLKLDVDLSAVAPGLTGKLGELPAASLPLIAAVLGGIYELDNTPEPEDKDSGKGGKSKPPANKKVRIVEAEGDDDAEGDVAEAPARRAKR